jgi:hypothetical protein
MIESAALLNFGAVGGTSGGCRFSSSLVEARVW